MTIFALDRKLALVILVLCCVFLGCQNDAAPAVPDGAPFFEQAEQDRHIGDANKAVANYVPRRSVSLKRPIAPGWARRMSAAVSPTTAYRGKRKPPPTSMRPPGWDIRPHIRKRQL